MNVSAPPGPIPDAVRARARKIRLLAQDVDGTLTDGRLHLDANGGEIKSFNALDGQGLKLLQEAGIEVALITARNSPIVTRRAAELGLAHVYQGSHDKLGSLRALCQILALAPEQTAFIGDDLPDLSVLGWVGLAVAPANAHPWVRTRVHWITRSTGGNGAARELCDLILDAQDQIPAILQRYGAQ